MATIRFTVRRTVQVQVRRTVTLRQTFMPQYVAMPTLVQRPVQLPATAQRTSRVVTSSAGTGGLDDLYVAPPSPDREWDVFISYASEDKATVAILASELRTRGIRAWFDETELTIGMGLRRSIDHGLANSRFGVVFMSHAFFKKEWTQRELDGLVALQVQGRQRVLPVWHGITHDDVLGYSPTLADTVAARTSDSSMAEIAAEITRIIQG